LGVEGGELALVRRREQLVGRASGAGIIGTALATRPSSPCSEVVVEKSEQLVVIALGNRIKFMVVAFRALHGEAEPRGAEGADAVGDVFDAVFFVDDAAL
jgi:hypothetical protein